VFDIYNTKGWVLCQGDFFEISEFFSNHEGHEEHEDKSGGEKVGKN
jgi:hypothetical protein